MVPSKVNVAEKLALFSNSWSPKLGEIWNDSYIELDKLKGKFVWHNHGNEDELFFVTKDSLVIKMRDREVRVDRGISSSYLAAWIICQ